VCARSFQGDVLTDGDAHADGWARQALARIPKILTLMDRNPHSPTYGCCDRAYWHYRIIDFPSGMSQELVWPLALAWDTAVQGNVWHRSPAVRSWVEAGIEFARSSSHRNGACDDYFPFEQAAGAAAFSLLACIESYQLVGLDDERLTDFFSRRADWLASHRESGKLANHLAVAALALCRLGAVLGTRRWDGARDELLRTLLSWQHDEGWFAEYDGFDPGYHTLTISSLARIQQLLPDRDDLRQAVERAVRLAIELVHPDGSWGGEVGSRDTFNYFPHGFELVGRWMPQALALNDRVLGAVNRGVGPCIADDRIIGHHAWNQLLAFRDRVAERPAPSPHPEGRLWLEGAGVLVDRRGGFELFAAPGKGGVFKLFKDRELVVSDTQVSLRVQDGGGSRTAVAHLRSGHQVQVEEDLVEVRGRFSWANLTGMTTPRLLLLRAVMLMGGRLCPDLIRRVLQRWLITGRRRTAYEFERIFRWEDGGITVTDSVRGVPWSKVRGVAIGCDQTSTATVMSRFYHPHQLHGWMDLTPRTRDLDDGEELTIGRRYE